MKYYCKQCGKEHEGWPALGYNSPFQYNILSEEDKKNLSEITDDFCIIKHLKQTDRFIRAVLQLKITDHCDTLEYGI